jgi:ubiquinone/menaquinone biosynthesis C-methylase UbiE
MNKKPFNGPPKKSFSSRKPSAYRSERSSSSTDKRLSRTDSRTDSRGSNGLRSSQVKPSSYSYRDSASRPSFKRSDSSSFESKNTKSSRYPRKDADIKRVSTTDKPEYKKSSAPAKPTSTSWGGVASWYNEHLEKDGDTYHEKVIYPNLLRILGDEKGQLKGKKVLDLACGQGQFSRLMRDKGAHVTGIDLGKELITIAESHNVSIKEAGTHKATYLQGSADDLYMLKDGTFEVVVCILALQNIENLQKTIEEAKRVLVPGGTFIFVLNHPIFRNPRQTHWGYDEVTNTQFRRVDEYMTESHYKIDMTPGSKTDKKFTVTFHRPLQIYVKALSKAGLPLTRLEEWVSHKESEKGPRQKAENKSRKEIPLFMCIESKK